MLWNCPAGAGKTLVLPSREKGDVVWQRVLYGWLDRLSGALARGFEGLRLSSNTFWLEKADWSDFAGYEAPVDSVICRHRMLAICTCCLDRCSAVEVLDAIKNHQFALIKRAGC